MVTKIGGCLNVTPQDIMAKKFNVFVGVSLGNKFFMDRANMTAYITWAIANSKEHAAIIIPDKIHAVNFEARSGYTPERAINAALRKGDETQRYLERLIAKLPEQQQKCISIFRWEELEMPAYQNQTTILYEAFAEDPIFHDRIIDIVKENTNGLHHITEADYEVLARYVIDEMPLLAGGLIKDGFAYDLVPYPGFGKIDYLAIDLQSGATFPELSKRLGFKKIASIELFTIPA